jgi:hypothetical protein
MRHLVKSKVFMWAWFLAGVFTLLALTVPRLQLMTILNGVFLGVVVAVIIVYSPVIWFTARKGRFDRVAQLSLGIGLMWLSIAGNQLYWIVWHYYGAPQSWQSNPFLASLVFLSIIGGCLFVTAPGFPPEGSLEPKEFWGTNRNLLLFFGVLGGIVTFGLSVFTGNAF